MNRRRAAAILTALLASSAACSEQTQSPAPADVHTARNQQPPAVSRLPVSLNTVMVAMINQAADPLWVAAWHNPATDKDWRELERRAVQLELGGTLLTVPGTGPLDDTWVANPAWRRWALKLRDVGADAVQAVKDRDIGQISAVGDATVDICEGCHAEFKLALPTGGEFGELSPRADDLSAPKQ